MNNQNIILVGEKLYEVNPDTQDLTPVTLCEHQMVFTRGFCSIIEKHTGKVICKIALAHRLAEGFSAPTKAQLEDAKAFVAGEIQPSPSRTKKTFDNPHAKELFYYQQSNLMKFRDCVYVICSNTENLKNSQNGKFNFNFNDLCRILVSPQFTIDHLFSDDRGNRYTLRAYHACVNQVLYLCRKEFKEDVYGEVCIQESSSWSPA